jgi:hypothetical protein
LSGLDKGISQASNKIPPTAPPAEDMALERVSKLVDSGAASEVEASGVRGLPPRRLFGAVINRFLSLYPSMVGDQRKYVQPNRQNRKY